MRVHDPEYTYHQESITIRNLRDYGPHYISSFPSITCYEGAYCSFDVSPYFEDDENDTISYDYSYSDYATGLSININTGFISGTPGPEHVKNSTQINYYIYPQDNHYPETNRTHWTLPFYIWNNTSPYNITTIADRSFDAGYPLNFDFDDDIFNDTDGETVNLYTFSSSPDATGWLSFDSTSRIFSGTPTVNTEAYNYTITIYAQDPNVYSAHGETYFYLDIVPNDQPEYDAGLVTPTNVTVHFPFTYTVNADAFKDKESDAYTIRYELDPDSFTTTYDSTTRTVTGTLDDNTIFGTYTMKFYVEDSWNVSTFTAPLDFYYHENMSPVVVLQPSDPA